MLQVCVPPRHLPGTSPGTSPAHRARAVPQMTDTHPERRRVRSVFGANWGDGEVRVSEERQQKMDVRTFLTVLGRHRFVLSPRGNGLDAHRTWEALLVRLKTRVVHLACTSPASRLHLACTSPASPQVGTIPIVRSSALDELYEALPVLVVRDWTDVTPALLREFHANYTARREFYQYVEMRSPR